MDMEVIILLTIHVLICLLVLCLMKNGRIRTRHQVLAAVILLPVWGMLLLLVDEWQIRHGHMAVKEADDYIVELDNDVWKREVTGQNEDEFTVPLEEAMKVNSSSISRRLMMRLLHAQPERYVELLKKVTMSDDVELTHYATTAMMEIQGRYELRIGSLLSQLQENPDDIGALMRCRSELNEYINSGLISDTVLRQYRLRLDEVLKALCRLEPDALRYEFEDIENSILLGRLEGMEERLAKLERKYPQDDRVYRCCVEYYYHMHDGKVIRNTLSRMKERGVYLNSNGKKWLEIWEPKGSEG